MKMMYEVGDVFKSDLGQIVMLCEVDKDLYKLIVISNLSEDIGDKLKEEENMCKAGERWDDVVFNSEKEASEFIKNCENLVNYVENVRTILSNLYKTNIQ